MALKENASHASQKFENPEDDNGDTAVLSAEDQAAAQRAAAQARLQEAADRRAAEKPAEETKSTSTALSKPAGGQVAKARPMVNPLEPLKGAFHVEYDTLRNLKLSNGNLIDQQTGKVLGSEFGLELLSYQDQWVISPGGDDKDKDANKEHVRYSDDGVTTSKGDDCKAYMATLAQVGYPDAKMTKRTVICGSLFDIGEKGRKTLPELQDCLVQMSLPPTSKASFDRYTMDQAFKIAKGLIEPEGAQRIKIEATPVSKGDKDWTIANFSRWIDA